MKERKAETARAKTASVSARFSVMFWQYRRTQDIYYRAITRESSSSRVNIPRERNERNIRVSKARSEGGKIKARVGAPVASLFGLSKTLVVMTLTSF